MQVVEKVTIHSLDKKRREGVEALFDTGAKSSFISEKVAEKIGFVIFEKPLKVPLATEGNEAEIIGSSTIFLTLDGYELPLPCAFNVTKGLRKDLIVGTSLMEEFDIKLDLEKGKVRLEKTPPEVVLFQMQ